MILDSLLKTALRMIEYGDEDIAVESTEERCCR